MENQELQAEESVPEDISYLTAEAQQWATASSKGEPTYKLVGPAVEPAEDNHCGGKRGKNNWRGSRRRQVSARTKARMRAVDTLYEAIIKRLDQEASELVKLIGKRQELTTAQTVLPSFSVALLKLVAEHIYQIDMLLEQFSQGWSLDRMPPVDLAILRVGVAEIKFSDDVDYRIVIDEMVKIAALISSDESLAFINAMLDRIAKYDGVLPAPGIASSAESNQNVTAETAVPATTENGDNSFVGGVWGLTMEDEGDVTSWSSNEQDNQTTLEVPSPVEQPITTETVTAENQLPTVELDPAESDESAVEIPAEGTLSFLADPVTPVPSSEKETTTVENYETDFAAEALDADVAKLVSKLLEN